MTNDDLELRIESTWIEDNKSTPFNRVVIMEFFCSDVLSSRSEDMFKTVGQPLRDRISAKLQEELGLEHEVDYVFGVYDNPQMKGGKWIHALVTGDLRTIIRLRDEEHYAMFKLHYHGN